MCAESDKRNWSKQNEIQHRLAVVGASGKTGWRVVDEALKRGMAVRAIVRPASTLPEPLAQRNGTARWTCSGLSSAPVKLSFMQSRDARPWAATGAIPGPPGRFTSSPQACELLGPDRSLQDRQFNRVVLVSSLCEVRWLHPLNLLWPDPPTKRLGEHCDSTQRTVPQLVMSIWPQKTE